jgi:hypothetical protein
MLEPNFEEADGLGISICNFDLKKWKVNEKSEN